MDYALTEDDILNIIREHRAAQSSGGSVSGGGGSGAGAASEEDEVPKTYSMPELKEWMDFFKNSNSDMDRMEQLLSQHPSLLNAKQGGIGNTALHWAAARDKTTELRFLLDKNATLSPRNSAGATPLHSAATHGQVNAVSVLLVAGVLGSFVQLLHTPLHVQCSS